MKYATFAFVVSLGVAVPALASAQELGSKGDAIFSVDRLMGITSNKVTEELPPGDVSRDYTSFSFGWRGAPELSPYDVARFAFDYLPIDHLSIGGSLGYASVDGSGNGSTADYSAFLLSPRVGYLYSFGRVVGIWPRGGFTYHSTSVGDIDRKGFALTLECPFTFSPTNHFAFHVGPTLDFDLFGDVKGPPALPKHDYTVRSFGLNVGVLGWL